MPNIPDVVVHLFKVDRPVIFLDTCILLDVIRSVERRDVKCAEHAAKLYAAATTAPVECCVVVSHVVDQEWRDHEPDHLREARAHLAKIDEDSDIIHDACAVFGIVPGFPRASFAGLGLETRIHDLSRKLLDCATVIDHDDECIRSAGYRVLQKRPPSKKGRGFNDCLIVEQCLAVCRKLYAAQFTRTLVFCTSNTNDYGKGSRPHVNLATDFDAVGLQYASNLFGGFHKVTH